MLARLQKFGGFLAGMVIPNIGAFIAWGLITAFFIPTGWTPNEDLVELVGPIIVYLLPVLIGFTGGKMVYGHRGGVIGSIATMGIIVGADFALASGATGDPPQFLGAMVVGPLAAWIMMKVDEAFQDKSGCRFRDALQQLLGSASSAPFGLAIIGRYIMGPIMGGIANASSATSLTPSTTPDCYHWRTYPSKSERCCSSTTPSTTASLRRSAQQRLPKQARRSTSCWKPTPARGSDCSWLTGSPARVWPSCPLPALSSFTSLVESMRSTSRTFSCIPS